MNTNYTEISLTYTLGGEYLVKPGKYTDALVEVSNPFTRNENVKVVKPSITEELAIFSNATKNITLGKAFINAALERPIKPKNNATQTEYDLFRNWNKLSMKHKIALAVEQYVKDMGGYNPVFEIL